MAKSKKYKHKNRLKRKIKKKYRSFSSQAFYAYKEDPNENKFVKLYEYRITDEPIDIWNVPEEINEEIEKIFNTINIDPSSMIIRLKELIKTYPNVPQLYNYLSVAYSRLGQHEEAEKIVVENYKKNKNYLFAKLNYAEICIQKGEYELVPEILEGKFDIKALYPNRDIFHITEVVGYWGIAGLYFVGIGKNDTAKIFYDNLKKLVPEHPYTKKLKQHFLVSSVKESFNKYIFPSKHRK